MGLIDFSRTCSCTAGLRAIRASLATIITNEEKIMTALADLQAADTALKDEVATFLTDVAAALTSAGTDPAALEAVVADINTEVAALKAGDPATPPAAPVPPVPPTA